MRPQAMTKRPRSSDQEPWRVREIQRVGSAYASDVDVSGALPATQRGVSPRKAALRRAFHPQVRQQIGHMLQGPNAPFVTTTVGGFDFVSPVHERFRTAAELDILLLTRSGSKNAGDTDNRLKTLVDGLTRPASDQQMQGFAAPDEGGPTYCLLDDDSLVQSLKVESREWFGQDAVEGDSLVVVTARIVLGRNVDMTAPTGSMFIVL
jgi:hypothetical protein